MERKIQEIKNSFFAFGRFLAEGEEKRDKISKSQGLKKVRQRRTKTNERRGEISVCGACGGRRRRKRRQSLFNCGATLQQSSDLFYQKLVKIESKILTVPASAAAARKRPRKNYFIISGVKV